MTNISTAEILDKGINCLLEKLGTVETEQFISIIIREKSDYTKWRRQYFDAMSAEEFNDAAVAYAKSHPFQAKKNLHPIE
ncbi:hypothetical protein C817_03257 [Dorea sp. 5-2]|nr:hypothetical protein C817_03257 [Dorea sp. 5-2]